MRVRIRNKYWNLRFVPNFSAHGECDGPTQRDKAIRIRAGLRPKVELETLVHEMLHAGLWDVSEDTVDRVSAGIADRLTSLGWRKSRRRTPKPIRPSRRAATALADDLRYVLRSRIVSIDGFVLDAVAEDIAIALVRLGWSRDEQTPTQTDDPPP